MSSSVFDPTQSKLFSYRILARCWPEHTGHQGRRTKGKRLRICARPRDQAHQAQTPSANNLSDGKPRIAARDAPPGAQSLGTKLAARSITAVPNSAHRLRPTSVSDRALARAPSRPVWHGAAALWTMRVDAYPPPLGSRRPSPLRPYRQLRRRLDLALLPSIRLPRSTPPRLCSASPPFKDSGVAPSPCLNRFGSACQQPARPLQAVPSPNPAGPPLHPTASAPFVATASTRSAVRNRLPSAQHPASRWIFRTLARHHSHQLQESAIPPRRAAQIRICPRLTSSHRAPRITTTAHDNILQVLPSPISMAAGLARKRKSW